MDIPGYKIIRTLGHGGMATVYLAIQESFEREVALKIMSSSLSADPTFGERFLREARIVSRLVHPNIVTVYDVGVHAGYHFLSMEYVPGQDLKQRRLQLSCKECLRVIKEVARALDFASKKGYVHRDVKPENIMLHEEDGRAVLMDFGIARPADAESGMTQTGIAIGTPHYMSPEQAKGLLVDSRSDIYSLGVVLYLMLAGHVPFEADSAVAVGIKHVSEPVPRLPESLQRFQGIIDKVLAKDPQQRNQNGAELIAALNQITGRDLAAVEEWKAEAEHRPLGSVDSDAPTVVSGSIPVLAGNNAAAETVAVQTTPVPFSEIATAARPNQPEVRLRRGGSDAYRAAAGGAAVEAMPAAAERTEQGSSAEKAALWPWFAGLAIAASVAGGVYYQHQLNQQIHSRPGDQAEFSRSSPSPLAVEQTLPLPQKQVKAPPENLSDALETPVSAATDAVQTAPPPAPAKNISVTPAIAPQAAVLEVSATTTPAGVPTPSPTLSDSPAVSAATEPTAASAPGQQALLERAHRLREQLDSDLSIAPTLAQTYRDILVNDPQHQQARWGLAKLRELYSSRLRQYLEDGDLDRVNAYVTSAKQSFPQMDEEDPKYQRLLQRIEEIGRLQALLNQGWEYLKSDALSSPPGANALESFQAVLAQDKGNERAQQGIAEVVTRYRVLAQERLRQREPEQARLLVEKGLAIAPDDEPLVQLTGDIAAEIARQQRLREQLDEARQGFARGQLIAPRGESALDRYQAVLAQDNGNSAALKGIKEVEQALVQSIDKLIAAGDLEAAQDRLSAAHSRFAESEMLRTAQTRLDRALEDKALAERPSIPQVAVGNSKLTSVDGPAQDKLRVERTIHIGFRYQNFKQPTSVVQAILYDGARSLQIAQVPVIVTGDEGVTFFRIDRPVEGFADGGYNIDLLLNQDRLTSIAFRVENSNSP